MRRLHLVGGSGHGKTTLIEALLREWVAQGLRVGTIKHTGHVHELDAPGKDSWRHRQGGASPAAVIAGDRLALHRPLGVADDPYAILAAHYADCDLVLVEGHLEASAPKVEVWRAAVGSPPLASVRNDILAVISDDQSPVGVPVLPRRDVPALATRLLRIQRPGDVATG
jgi:molybdopterin-guanine dinucleotide biosynthesis protein B